MLRDILMWLAISEPKLFRAKWSETIHHEWMAALKSDHPTVRVERIRERMNQAVDDCLVEGYKQLIEGLSLPDPGDRHVLAAAIVCNADVIVTNNLKDFPFEARKILVLYGEWGVGSPSSSCLVNSPLTDEQDLTLRGWREAHSQPGESAAADSIRYYEPVSVRARALASKVFPMGIGSSLPGGTAYKDDLITPNKVSWSVRLFYPTFR
jgi:hypothetical protein